MNAFVVAVFLSPASLPFHFESTSNSFLLFLTFFSQLVSLSPSLGVSSSLSLSLSISNLLPHCLSSSYLLSMSNYLPLFSYISHNSLFLSLSLFFLNLVLHYFLLLSLSLSLVLSLIHTKIYLPMFSIHSFSFREDGAPPPLPSPSSPQHNTKADAS